MISFTKLCPNSFGLVFTCILLSLNKWVYNHDLCLYSILISAEKQGMQIFCQEVKKKKESDEVICIMKNKNV